MTAYEIWAEALAAGGVTTRQKIDEYFAWCSTAPLDDQIALELSPNDDGSVYTNKLNEQVRIEN